MNKTTTIQKGQIAVKKNDSYIKPRITLTGKWLKELGFEVGCKLEVITTKNTIILKNKNARIRRTRTTTKRKN